MTATKTTCSLCRQDIATSELGAHCERETREIVEYTISMIKSRHPEWTANDPTCQMCWDYYQSLPAT